MLGESFSNCIYCISCSYHYICPSHSLSCILYCSLFFMQEMELSLIGLQNAGKTSLVNVVAVSILLHVSDMSCLTS